MTVKPVTRTTPVIEIFGPTIQGEGPDAGRPAYFVRVGGCDFRCSWCDSMYAVDPAAVREHAERMTADDVRRRLGDLGEGPRLVVLTGGNPALHRLDALVDGLHEDGFEVAVETQGSTFRPWLAEVDRLVVSPKPPSSGEATPRHWAQLVAFMGELPLPFPGVAFKVVVFDDRDLEYARTVTRRWPGIPLHLSTGTDPHQAADVEADRAQILDRFRWLCESAARDPLLGDARIGLQLHVMAWGRERGV